MRTYLAGLLILSVVATGVAVPAYSQDKKGGAHNVQVFDDTTFEKLTKLAAPAEMQNLLASIGGEWNYTVTTWLAPGAEPEQSTTGATTNELVLGGRALSMKSAGILNVDGRTIPYEGQGFMAFDNIKKVFTSVWIDTLSPGMMIGSGTYDTKENLIKETGRYTPPLKDSEQAFRSELHFTDAESYKRTIFAVAKGGKEFKTMEIEYRKKR